MTDFTPEELRVIWRALAVYVVVERDEIETVGPQTQVALRAEIDLAQAVGRKIEQELA